MEELVEQFALLNGKFNRISTYTKQDKLASQVLPGLVVELDQVFDV